MAEIRVLADGRWVPILFVTADSDVDSQVLMLAQGADDYLVKPVHQEILRAKLQVAARLLTLHRQIEEKKRALEIYHDANEDEMRVAKHLMARMVQQDQVADPMLEHFILPAANLSGDLVAAARTPHGVLHVMLADGTGHGLAAALNVLPITPCFYAMTQKGLAIEAIAATLNRTVRQQLPSDRFVATTLLAIDYAARRVKIWNGGNPPVFAFDAAGKVLSRFQSRNLALGILSEAAFVPEFDVFDYTEPCELFVCSDGVFESLDDANIGSGEAEVTSLMLGVSPRMRTKYLRNRLAARNAEKPAHDDMTFLFVQCADEPVAAAHDEAPAAVQGPAWRFELTLGPSEMREIDVVSMLLDLVSALPAARGRRRELSVVLSELYANALDHGVLGLESSLKNVGGIERFTDTRAAALRDLRDGSITIKMAARVQAGRPLLDIVVADSGTGFNPALLAKDAIAMTASAHGRGIALLRALCVSVEYRGRGNEVSVCYGLETPVTDMSCAA
jgi:serine phosphatase RsbU (regulator of sigma subunit)/anti-sigma regulatory factor (Ser/Thr protein kinase)